MTSLQTKDAQLYKQITDECFGYFLNSHVDNKSILQKTVMTNEILNKLICKVNTQTNSQYMHYYKNIIKTIESYRPQEKFDGDEIYKLINLTVHKSTFDKYIHLLSICKVLIEHLHHLEFSKYENQKKPTTTLLKIMYDYLCESKFTNELLLDTEYINLVKCTNNNLSSTSYFNLRNLILIGAVAFFGAGIYKIFKNLTK